MLVTLDTLTSDGGPGDSAITCVSSLLLLPLSEYFLYYGAYTSLFHNVYKIIMTTTTVCHPKIAQLLSYYNTHVYKGQKVPHKELCSCP